MAAGSLRRDGRYRIARHCEIAPLPVWVADALTPAQLRCEPGQGATRPPRTPGRYLQAILDGEADAVAAAQTGTRHAILLAAACTLGRLIAGGELDDHAARITLLRAAARHVGVDGMSQREVTDTISDGLRYGSQRPRSLTAPQPRQATRQPRQQPPQPRTLMETLASISRTRGGGDSKLAQRGRRPVTVVLGTVRTTV